MKFEFDDQDISEVQSMCRFADQKIGQYGQYPSEAFKKQRLSAVRKILIRIQLGKIEAKKQDADGGELEKLIEEEQGYLMELESITNGN